jgi:poly-beta-1,6-N-acetyl-D-glucosamine N-deacetylase
MRLSLRNIIAWFVAKGLILSGSVDAATKRALHGEYILSIYFHKPSKKEFEACIRWLKKKGFHFLSTSDLDNIIHGLKPFPKGGVLLTVDDGWQSNEENVVSVANKYCIPVTIFIATAPVEEGVFWWTYWLKDNTLVYKNKLSVTALKKEPNKVRLVKVEEMKKVVPVKRNALTVEQVQKAAHSQYISIGGHTHTHPILTNCDEEELRFEVQVCKQKLECWTDKEIPYFAYPNGDYDQRVIQVLKQANYRLAFSTQQNYLTPDRIQSQYAIPRISFLENVSFAENVCRMVGVWAFSKKRLKPGTSSWSNLVFNLYTFLK